jgi:hypothetical protein
MNLKFLTARERLIISITASPESVTQSVLCILYNIFFILSLKKN